MGSIGEFGRNVRLERVRIAGVASAVPRREVDAQQFVARFGESAVAEVVKLIGVNTRYWADETVTSADLCARAAECLMQELAWTPNSIDALVYVTQTPDYRLPATACTLQTRLGLRTSCAAFDINLGCSGYTYGLWVAMSLARSGNLDRVLLLAGDTISKTLDPGDRSTALLFGDAGSATAIETTGVDWFAQFVLGSDGLGARHLVIPSGGFRTLRATDDRLAGRNPAALFMDGGEIFHFTLTHVPGLVMQALEQTGLEVADVDAFVFHQANRFMLTHIARKLKIPADRFPTNIDRFGNTSSASIPLVLTSELPEMLLQRRCSVAMTGFGVGYSWASALLPVGPLGCARAVSL